MIHSDDRERGQWWWYSTHPMGSYPRGRKPAASVAYADVRNIDDSPTLRFFRFVNIYRVTGDWHGGNLEYHFQIAETMQSLINVKGAFLYGATVYPLIRFVAAPSSVYAIFSREATSVNADVAAHSH